MDIERVLETISIDSVLNIWMYLILRRYETPLIEVLPPIFLCPAGNLCNNGDEETLVRQMLTP